MSNCGQQYMRQSKAAAYVTSILTELQCSNVVHEAVAVRQNSHVYIPDDTILLQFQCLIEVVLNTHI